MLIIGLLDLCDAATDEPLADAVEHGLLSRTEAKKVALFRKGAPYDGESHWRARVALSGASSRSTVVKKAADLEGVEQCVRHAFDAAVRSPRREGPRVGLTLRLADDRRIVGPCFSMSDDEFSIVSEDGRGEIVTLRYEHVTSAGHYNR